MVFLKIALTDVILMSCFFFTAPCQPGVFSGHSLIHHDFSRITQRITMTDYWHTAYYYVLAARLLANNCV
jgi:hypothetical protein